MTAVAATPAAPVAPVPSADALFAHTRRSAVATVLTRAWSYRRLRGRVLKLVGRLEGGPFYSRTWRELLATHHAVRVGAYTYGACMTPGAFPPGVTIGRYGSIAAGTLVFRRNHPLERLSTHPFFYNHQLGYVPADNIPAFPLEIGPDVWLGANTIITTGCKRIGLGAVVAAGAVVTRDVPDFAIVGGNPARLIRYRFDEHVQERVRASRWWERSIDDLLAHRERFLEPLQGDLTGHPLLVRCGRDFTRGAGACT